MDLDSVKRTLEEKLALLTDRVTRIQSHLRDPGSKDWAERATERENEEVLERLDESERDEIRAIQGALARIEQGTYGTCARCGDEIAARRLEALPFTPVCVSCAD